MPWFSRVKRLFSLPLFMREITEQANRPRTYILRTAYAMLFMGIFAAYYLAETAHGGGGSSASLGMGRRLGMSIIILHTIGIILFLPSMTAGAITSERESGSLPLLLITDMSARDILLQKLLGRTLPVFMMLFSSLPALGLAYMTGGLSLLDLIMGGYAVIALVLLAGTATLYISALSSSTTEALTISYALFGAGLAVLAGVSITGGGGYDFVGGLMALAVPGTIVSAILLYATWHRLSVYPLSGTANPFTRFLKWLDEVLRGARKFAGEKRMSDDEFDLLETAPVYWLDSNKKTFLKNHHLVVVAILSLPILLPVETAAHWLATLNTAYSEPEWAVGLYVVGFAAAVLAVLAMSTGAVAGERSSRTLSLLAITPIKPRDMILQKARSLRRFTFTLSLPLLCMILARTMRRGEYVAGCYHGTFLYLLIGVGGIAIYLPLAMWVGLWIGLRTKRRLRAMLTAVGAAAAWTGGALAVEMPLHEMHAATAGGDGGAASFLMGINPCINILYGSLGYTCTAEDPLVTAGMLHGLFIHAMMLFLVRQIVLINADNYFDN
ncbi:MAG: hypothetical protein JW909_07965 [Planctomycetes bacterium]|nr:hypothetical protein [Planctomycetota bacterium]